MASIVPAWLGLFLSIYSITTTAHPSFSWTEIIRRDATDPQDYSVISKLAAIGDSYSSGIGADAILDGDGDKDCSRYRGAHPVLVNAYINDRLGNEDRDFEFLSCAAATTQDASD